eukprot:3283465-Rhodomonas_salina.1
MATGLATFTLGSVTSLGQMPICLAVGRTYLMRMCAFAPSRQMQAGCSILQPSSQGLKLLTIYRRPALSSSSSSGASSIRRRS